MQPLTYRVRLAGVIMVALVLSMAAQTAHAQKGKPLNQQEVLELLQGGVPSARVNEIVTERGISFEFTSALEKEVRSSGGGDDLVATLRRLSKHNEEPDQPRGGNLRIQTHPGEAQVYINDEPKGITSPEGEIRFTNLKPGSYKVRVSLLGYQSWENTIKLEAGENETIPVTLTQKQVVSPVINTPVVPSTGIPLPGLGAPNILFFEGPHDSMPSGSARGYRTVFPKSTTRTIYWEIDLNFSRPGVPVNFKLVGHWVKPDGTEMGQQPLDVSVGADATSYSNALGWGWVDAGNWPVGTHRVDFYLGDAHVTSGSFQISDAPVPLASGFGIPGLQTPVVQFYEGPHDKQPAKDTRVYRYVFPQSSTRTIYWEVDLTFPKPSQKINFQLTAHWIKPDGTEMGHQTLDNGYVVPEWGTSWHSLGWGWVDTGHWPIGTHRVDFYVGSTLVASGSFQVN